MNDIRRLAVAAVAGGLATSAYRVASGLDGWREFVIAVAVFVAASLIASGLLSLKKPANNREPV